ncbi:MAG: response regulator [Pseudomonas sp.]|uniref:response regulator n=1 Tax=Pseudomonas sp. TaxID=306 RepID=UPI003D6E7027
MSSLEPIRILIADDDQDDCLMIKEAFKEAFKEREMIQLHFVHDGESLLSYLRNLCPFDRHVTCPMPSLMLLDLNMPLMDGREALALIKADAALSGIPVVVLSTSSAKEEIDRSRAIGASEFITKPASFNKLVSMVGSLDHYWLDGGQPPIGGSKK